MTEAGLRERKKQRTRDAIIDAALRLFDERGFDHTTIADIAEAADIAPRTFFGYFPSKEEVVFDDFSELFDQLAQRLRGREAGETAVDAMRAWFSDYLETIDLTDERSQCRHRVVEGSETLGGHRRALLGRVGDLLAEEVARDLDEEAGGLRSRLVAAAATAALDVHAGQGMHERRSKADAIAVIDQAMVFLQGGLAALQREAGQSSR